VISGNANRNYNLPHLRNSTCSEVLHSELFGHVTLGVWRFWCLGESAKGRLLSVPIFSLSRAYQLQSLDTIRIPLAHSHLAHWPMVYTNEKSDLSRSRHPADITTSNTPYANHTERRDPETHKKLIGERIQRERPCRTLFVRNVSVGTRWHSHTETSK
jgi:hypothetical protein